MKMLNMYECTPLNEQELLTVNGGSGRSAVYFDVTIVGKAAGRILVELYNDTIVPKIGAEVNVNV
ncbi:hypothetical protein [Chitinophaga sp. 212800010-3]|uniref:hypothetical protein n=1 Tax=unclassified Chitinophaga TaxID=2619133 RepID=UPI002DF510A4|nr:hypothetical protein [Chitinophaga sp. 212800010-3]